MLEHSQRDLLANTHTGNAKGSPSPRSSAFIRNHYCSGTLAEDNRLRLSSVITLRLPESDLDWDLDDRLYGLQNPSVCA